MGNSTSKQKFCGWSLILTHELFDEEDMNRPGNHKDVERLKSELERCSFNVNELLDTQAKFLTTKLKNYVTRTDWSKFSCLLVIVSTHGDKSGKLYGSRGQHDVFYTSDVWTPFMDCPALKNKKKVFVFQACRGTELEAHYPGGQGKRVSSTLPPFPRDTNSLFVYSTYEARVALRDRDRGTIFLQFLCDAVEKCVGGEDVLELLTRVTERVVRTMVKTEDKERTSQTPVFVSFLHQALALPKMPKPRARKPKVDPALPGCSRVVGESASGVIAGEVVSAGGDRVEGLQQYSMAGSSRALVLHSPGYENLGTQLLASFNTLGAVNSMQHAMTAHEILDLLTNESKSLSETADIPSLFLAAVLHPLTFHQFGEQGQGFWGLGRPDVPLHGLWAPFRATECPALRNRPKVFLLLDPAEELVADSLGKIPPTKEKTPEDFIEVTEHADLLIVRAFGSRFVERLIALLQKGGGEIFSLLTAAMQHALSKEQHDKDSRLSHFESSLTKRLILASEQQQQQQQDLEAAAAVSGLKQKALLDAETSDAVSAPLKKKRKLSTTVALPSEPNGCSAQHPADSNPSHPPEHPDNGDRCEEPSARDDQPSCEDADQVDDTNTLKDTENLPENTKELVKDDDEETFPEMKAMPGSKIPLSELKVGSDYLVDSLAWTVHEQYGGSWKAFIWMENNDNRHVYLPKRFKENHYDSKFLKAVHRMPRAYVLRIFEQYDDGVKKTTNCKIVQKEEFIKVQAKKGGKNKD